MVCFRLVRVPEIEIIGDRQSSRSRTSQVTHTFYKGDLSTFVRIKMAETIVTVIGDSQVLINSCNAQSNHTRIASGFNLTTRHDHVIILLPNPTLRRNGWVA